MIITEIQGNRFKLDGGALFGNCPRALWQRWYTPDEQNCVEVTGRALLVQVDGQRILLEAGIGVYMEPHLRDRYGVSEDRHMLLEHLRVHGLDHTDIDVIIISHLHFDHSGGLLTAWQADKQNELLFPKARFLVSRPVWQRATNPHPRDRGSYIELLGELLEGSGRLEFVDCAHHPGLPNAFSFQFVDGHTPGMIITELDLPEGPLLFAADLIPGMPWMHLPITMGYDRYPELVVNEKRAVLEDLLARSGSIFFVHDPSVAIAKVARETGGKYYGKVGE